MLYSGYFDRAYKFRQQPDYAASDYLSAKAIQAASGQPSRDRSLRAKLEKIPTAYVLPRDQTDLLVKTAGELLRNNPQFKNFLNRVR